MGKQVIDAKTHSRAPRDVVWNILADGGSWSQWGPWTKSELDREGSPPPGGVDSIKRLARGWMTIREEVTDFEPPSRYGYRLLSRLPVRDYRAQVTLSDAADGTEIHWHSKFDARFPGTGGLVRRSLQRAVSGVASRLAAEAERHDQSEFLGAFEDDGGPHNEPEESCWCQRPTRTNGGAAV